MYELDLFENAIDSLTESIGKFEAGRNGDAKAFKFAVLHLTHFVELLFKQYVVDGGKDRIFKGKPAEGDERKTITFAEAVALLEEDGKTISPDLDQDLKFVRQLRNRIEHYKFAMDPEEVEDAFGRIIEAVVAYDIDHHGYDLQSHIGKEWANEFAQLAENYHARLKEAERKVDELRAEAYRGHRPKEYDLVRWQTIECPDCENETFVPDKASDSGWRCQFCGATESDEIEVNCAVCDTSWPRWQMSTGGEDGDEYWCPHCSGDPDYVKND